MMQRWCIIVVYALIGWSLAAPVYGYSSIASIVTGANGFVGRAVVRELILQEINRPKMPDLDDAGSGAILGLVRPHRVKMEQDYWDHFIMDALSSSSKNELATTNHPRVQVLPYDMLDGGRTLQHALDLIMDVDHREDRLSRPLCCIYHTATKFGPTEDHEQTARDNIQGTEDVVHALARHVAATSSPHPRRDYKLVLTSSMAAVRGTGQEPINGQYYTHQDWNQASVLGAHWGASYQYSKAESERRAWHLCQQEYRHLGLQMVALCPSFVFGPPSGPTQPQQQLVLTRHSSSSSSSYSVELVQSWMEGISPVQSRLFVDVRDVAQAHVAAARSTTASGQRYLVSTEARVPSTVLATWLQEACQEEMTTSGTNMVWDPARIHADTEFTGGAIPIGAREVEATDRLRQDLGITLRPVRETIMDMARALLRGTC